MIVVITGANGFLGLHLVKQSLRCGFKVIALIRSNANTELFPNDSSLTIFKIEYHNDLTAQFLMIKKKIGQVDYFIHNAGLTISLNSKDYFRVNTELTKEIHLATKNIALLKNSGKFVYISSYAAHGPLGINMPVSNYGRSKRSAEEYLQKEEIPLLIIRPTAIYGPGDTAFLPLFKAASKHIYPITNSNQKMTMIYVLDLARIVISEMQNSENILHVNDANEYSHDDFISTLSSVLDVRIWKIPLPIWLISVPQMIIDFWFKKFRLKPSLTLEKIKEISLNWNLHKADLPHAFFEAEFNLREGFQSTFDFYRKNKLI